MNKTPHILVLCESSRSSWRDYLMGIVKYSRLHNAGWVFHLIPPTSLTGDVEKTILDHIRQLNIRGIVDGLDNPAMTERLLATGVPCITYNPSPNEPFGQYIITLNNAEMGQMGAAHFLDKHFVNFAFCRTGPFNWSLERSVLFIDTLVKAGHRVEIYERPPLRGRYSWEKELPYLAKWLGTLAKPVGLMTDSDDRGQQILEACQVAGVKVPEEAAVLGVGNDDFICELTCPPMSSIHNDAESIGYQAAELLDRLINGQVLPSQAIVSHPTGIIERQSTDVLAVEDELVKQAVQFIRLNSTKPLSVGDVSEAVSATVRTLDRRFKKALGRSVHSEIARMRINQVCRMLVESSLSISQIAHKLGYPELKHLSRAFKQEKGVGPLTYRKMYTSI